MSKLIFCEIGESFPLISTENFIELIGKIYNKINPNEFCIIDSNLNLYKNIPNEREINSNEIFYIFLKNEIEEKLYIKLFEEIKLNVIKNSKFDINLNNSNFDINSNFNLISENSNNLKEIDINDIKFIYEKILENFENFKNTYKNYIFNSEFSKEVCDLFNNQILALNILTKKLSNNLDKSEKNKKIIIESYNKLVETKDLSINLLEKGINELKKTELIKKMQTHNKKFLIDIYYNESNMNNWKETCLKNLNSISSSIKNKSDNYTNQKNLIKQKITTMNSIINDIKNNIIEFNEINNKLEKKPKSIYNEINNDYLNYINAIIFISDYLLNFEKKENGAQEIFNKKFEENILNLKNLKKKYTNFDSIIAVFVSEMDVINTLGNKFQNNLENNFFEINKLFIGLENNNKIINEITNKYENIKKKIDSLENNFIQLQNPSYFPKAYQASINEMKRRYFFIYNIKKNINILNEYVSKENELRKKFLDEFGKYLPNDFNPKLNIQNLEMDFSLKNIDDLENFKYLFEDDIENYKTEILIYDPYLNLNENYNNIDINNNNNNIIINNSVNNINTNNSNKITTEDINKINEKLNKYEKIMNNLQNEIKNVSQNIDKISKNFQETMAQKKKELDDKNYELENLSNYYNNKYSGLDQCQNCIELTKKNSEIKKELSKYEENYLNLINQTTLIKKAFFNIINLRITEKNSKLEIINSKHKAQENLLITDYKILTNKFENEIKDKNNIEKNYNQIQKQLSLTNEKLFECIKENQNYKQSLENLKKNYNAIKIDNNELMTINNNLKVDLKKNLIKNQSLKKENDELYNEKVEGNILIDSYKIEKNELNKEINELKKNLLNYENLNKENEDKIIEIKKQNENLINEINKLKIENNYNLKNLTNNYLQYKNINIDSIAIFIPYFIEGIYICINLTENINNNDEQIYKSNLILDLSIFENEMKHLIIENNLIIIGKIDTLTKKITNEENNNIYGLHNNVEYFLVKLKEIYCVLGFPSEEELIIKNFYFNNKNNIINNINNIKNIS